MILNMIMLGTIFILAFVALKGRTKTDALAVVIALVIYAFFCLAVGRQV